ncbi:MAG: proton-conducting transporter membrane subunit [Nitrospira sp.]|jgi:NADH-quinone oxidoreductase subunit M|nr:proton-conducting transporter membrane subunit [Nitrospira sp.]
MAAPWLVAAVPILGALLGFAVWSRPEKLKTWSVSVTLVSLLAVAASFTQLRGSTEGLLFVVLLPLAACVSLLGQPVHKEHRLAWIMTLVSLGLGLGILTSPSSIGQIALPLLLGLITFLLYWHHDPFWGPSWLGIGTYGLGTLCAGIAAVTDSPLPSLLACAILLPLFPLHHGYVAALTRLPGSLPPFTVLLLPAIGLHRIATIVQNFPDAAASALIALALAGAVYATIKALAQSRVRLLLAYGSLAFFSILWWFVAAARTVRPQAAVFLGSVALVTGGLLLAWQVIRTRYGDDVDPRAISGLAARMPQFAVLISLLALAAMGLPPFGVFAGFMGLLLTTSLTLSVAPLVIALTWLAASWYILDLVQRLLFGRKRPDLRYEDVQRSEFASLLLVVLIMVALGLAPTNLFGGAAQPARAGVLVESNAWTR